MIIAIDLDNTICTPLMAPRSGGEVLKASKAILGASRVITKWYNEGHTIIVSTSRSSYLRKHTEDWLKKHKIPYTRLEMERLTYDIIIDDKGFRFKDWKNVEETLAIPEIKDDEVNDTQDKEE